MGKKAKKLPLRLQPIQVTAMSDDQAADDGGHWNRIYAHSDQTFRGHRAGEFRLDPQVSAEVKANFDARGLRVPLDFDHSIEGEPDGVEGNPAQGWISELDVRPDGLWGKFHFGPLAKQYVKDGSYPYLSPALVLDSTDPVSGKKSGARLSSVALVTQPFLSDQAPLAANQAAAEPADLDAVIAEVEARREDPAVALLAQREAELVTLRAQAARATELERELKKRDKKLAKLKDQRDEQRKADEERAEAEAEVDVDLVIINRQITGTEQRAALLSWRLADPEAFRKVYSEADPRSTVRATLAQYPYLMREVSTGGARDPRLPTTEATEPTTKKAKKKARKLLGGVSPQDHDAMVVRLRDKFIADGDSYSEAHERAVVEAHEKMSERSAALREAHAAVLAHAGGDPQPLHPVGQPFQFGGRQ